MTINLIEISKKAIIFLFLAGFSVSVNAAPSWLKEAIEASKDYVADKDATGIVIHKSTQLTISKHGSTKEHVRKAIKVLNQNSEGLATISIAVNSNRSAKGLKGWRIDKNGNEYKLKKENIVEYGYQQSSGYYDDQRIIYAVFPEVKAGDIFAFEYIAKEKRGVEGFYQAFVFQDSLPVLFTKFEVEIPDGWELHISNQYLEPVTLKREDNLFTWTAGNLPYRNEEVYMPSWSKLLRKVIISCHNPMDNSVSQFSTWQSASQWVYDLHANLAGSNEDLKATVSNIDKGLTSRQEKLEAIAEFVQNDIRYVAVEIGIGRFKPRLATVTLQNKFGDCKDKATLMKSMLAEAGIPSRPVLARAGGNVDNNLPSPFQFNHLILSIPLAEFPELESYTKAISGGYLFFDPTDPSTPFGNLPTILYGSKILPIAPDATKLIILPELEPENYRRTYYAEVKLNEDFSLVADIRIADYGNRASWISHMRESETEQEQIDYYKSRFAKSMTNPVIAGYQFFAERDSTWITFTLTGGNYLKKSGDYELLKADFFHPDTKNRLKKNKNRLHPITFGRAAIIETEVKWFLPGNLEINGKLDSTETKCDIASLKGNTGISGDTLTFYSYRNYNGKMLSPADYDQGRKYARKLNSVNKTKIILRRKI